MWDRHTTVQVHVVVIEEVVDQQTMALKDLFAAGVIGNNLRNLTRSMFEVDQAPAFALAGVDANVSCVIDNVQHVWSDIGRVGVLRSHDDAVVRINSVAAHDATEQRHDVPPLIFHTHM